MSPPTISTQQYKTLLERAAQARPLGKRMEYVVFPASIGIYALSVYLVCVSWWMILVTVPLMGVAMLVLSVVQHECAHGTLFRTKTMNDTVGIVCSFFTFLPHYSFVRGHRAHHRFIGNPEHKDPTESKPIKNSFWLRLLIRIRIFPALFFVGVFFPYFLYDFFPTATRRKLTHVLSTTVALSFIFLLHIGIGAYLQINLPYWIFVAGSFLCFGILYEHLFTQNQHAGLRPTAEKKYFVTESKETFPEVSTCLWPTGSFTSICTKNIIFFLR